MSSFIKAIPTLDGIDISKYQGKVDFERVKQSGMSFVIVRVGWAGYDGRIEGNGGLDSMYHEHMRGAIEAGLDVGVYVYSYTRDTAAALVAADEILELIKPYSVTYPIAFDIEETSNPVLTSQGKQGLSLATKAFLDRINEAGYQSCFYTYTSFYNAHLDAGILSDYRLWIADYRGNQALMESQINREYSMWQYKGDEGRCDGVSGPCDLNYCYEAFETAPEQPTDPEIPTVPEGSVDNVTDLLTEIRDELKAIHELLKSEL